MIWLYRFMLVEIYGHVNNSIHPYHFCVEGGYSVDAVLSTGRVVGQFGK